MSWDTKGKTNKQTNLDGLLVKVDELSMQGQKERGGREGGISLPPPPKKKKPTRILSI